MIYHGPRWSRKPLKGNGSWTRDAGLDGGARRVNCNCESECDEIAQQLEPSQDGLCARTVLLHAFVTTARVMARAQWSGWPGGCGWWTMCLLVWLMPSSRGSCVWTRYGTGLPSGNGTDATTNVEPAQTQEEGQEVFGPDTPPPGRAEANAREVEHRLGDLWEDGHDHLVEMMAEAVRIAYEHAETNAVLTTGMRLLWGSIAGYGQHRPHRVLLPPRWLQWIQGKIEVAMNEDAEATVEHEGVGLLHLLPSAGIPRQVVRDDVKAEGGEEMGLMQVDTPRARGRRPQQWIRILDSLRHMTPRIRQRVIGKLRGWLRRRLQGLGKDVGALAGMYRNVTEGSVKDECAAGSRCSEDDMENPEPGTPRRRMWKVIQLRRTL